MDGPSFHLSQTDAVAWLRTLPSESVDLVVTDPPYESLEKHRAIGTTTRLKHSKASSNDWFSIFPNARFPELFAEVHRVLRRNTHFYLYCDPETMFVAKPLAEAAGFKFWKPLIWDKCLGPDTLVWTARGVQRIADIVVGDRVALPEGGATRVRATRVTRAPSLKLVLSDGTSITASREHRFVLADGSQCEAQHLDIGSALCARPVRERIVTHVELDRIIPDDQAIHELPEATRCLWCGRSFESARAAAAHQARFCEHGRSKEAMAAELGLAPKRLRRWMAQRRLPRRWAKRLGLSGILGSRIQCFLQNDVEVWYPRSIELGYELGKVVGLFAAEGSDTSGGVSFALHANEKHLQNHIARFARSLGVRARVRIHENCCTVEVNFEVMRMLMRYFVGGTGATSKYFTPAVYAAPPAFRDGVLAGLLEGDGHWSHEDQRETFTSASADLATFVHRELQSRGFAAHLSHHENSGAGAWRTRHDPMSRAPAVTVLEIEDVGEQDLVDISVDDRDELFLLANGVVTHNCKIGMGYHYRARYECILFFEKGKRKLNDLGIADILEAPRISGGYPAEKPPSVSSVLITQSTEPGQLVIDPFMGSGSVGVAALSVGRTFYGNDLCAEAVQITRDRLAEGGGRELRSRPSPDDQPPAGQLGLSM